MRVSQVFATLLCLAAACSPDLSDDPIPVTSFPDIVINTTLPEYNSLLTHGYQNINGGGVRGIILYRLNSAVYYAYERNCSFQPNDACATVDVDVSGLYMKDTCCGSTFDFSGNPTSGPAFRPLRRYATSVAGSIVTITDEIE
jgi:hypothetical protein